MNVSLLNHLRVLFKLNVRYAAWSFMTHTNHSVVALTSVTGVYSKSKLSTSPVRCAGKTTLNFFKTKAWNIRSSNFMFYAHTAKMAVSGEETWDSWSIT